MQGLRPLGGDRPGGFSGLGRHAELYAAVLLGPSRRPRHRLGQLEVPVGYGLGPARPGRLGVPGDYDVHLVGPCTLQPGRANSRRAPVDNRLRPIRPCTFRPGAPRPSRLHLSRRHGLGHGHRTRQLEVRRPGARRLRTRRLEARRPRIHRLGSLPPAAHPLGIRQPRTRRPRTHRPRTRHGLSTRRTSIHRPGITRLGANPLGPQRLDGARQLVSPGARPLRSVGSVSRCRCCPRRFLRSLRFSPRRDTVALVHALSTAGRGRAVRRRPRNVGCVRGSPRARSSQDSTRFAGRGEVAGQGVWRGTEADGEGVGVAAPGTGAVSRPEPVAPGSVDVTPGTVGQALRG